MKCNISDIVEKQKKLDVYIHNKHNLKYVDIYDELVLALSVELGELANEVRCFKFWSLKNKSENDIILDEFIDGLHFIISICIAKKIDVSYICISDNISVENNKKKLTLLFNDLFSRINLLTNNDCIIEWFQKYLELGFYLGFDIEKIKTAYEKKNLINYSRQDNNY